MGLAAACAPVASLPPLPQDEVAAESRRQQVAQIRDYYGQLHRLDTVAFRLRTANRLDCKDWIAPQIGLFAATPRSLPRKYQSFAAEALALSWARATVISVVEGSPAAKAGIMAGDELTVFNNEPVPVSGTMADFLKSNGERPVQVGFRRDNVLRSATVDPVIGCAIPINLVATDEVNAFASDSRIVINSAMLKLARTDAQLAVIVGHELAHSNLGHLDKRKINSALGMVGGAAVDGGFLLGGVSTGGVFSRYFGGAGARAFSVDFEREAIMSAPIMPPAPATR